MFKANSLLFTTISIILVLVHLYIGHYFAPNGIDKLPVTMIIITILIFQFTKFKILVKLGVTLSLFLLLDIGLKLYAGGTHDYEGLDWMNLFYFIGIVICSPIIFYKVFKSNELINTTKILTVVIFIVFLYFQNYLFGNLGVGKSYPMN